MTEQDRGWIEILSDKDAEALWTKLFKLISRHSSIRNLLGTSRVSRERLQDLHADLTQDMFLRLHEKDRWQFYLDSSYTNDRVEHELYHIEIPNMVSQLLRDRYPESYRLVRRISTLLRTGPQFRHYPRLNNSLAESNNSKSSTGNHKLALKVYGLKKWPASKPMKSRQSFPEQIKDVAFRRRETRRTGRGTGSQIIISNEELGDLIAEIFEAIDSPADVRTVRSLVISRLAIEDSQFVSIDAEVGNKESAEADLLRFDFADQRATPEELLLEKEMMWQVDAKVAELFEKMDEAVRNKPRRYRTLLEVVWHCYFNPLSPSQSSVANIMSISASLVTHYRKIFDRLAQDVQVSNEEYLLFSSALNHKVSAMIEKKGEIRSPGEMDNTGPPATYQEQKPAAKVMTAMAFVASSGLTL